MLSKQKKKEEQHKDPHSQSGAGLYASLVVTFEM